MTFPNPLQTLRKSVPFANSFVVDPDTLSMQLAVAGVLQPFPQLIRAKLDLGNPGNLVGFDCGEGGSYKVDKDGDTVVKAFKYDASATSGSRFIEFTDLDVANTWLGAVGDRFYVGSPYKFWATRFNVTTAVVYGDATEIIQTQYWNGSALTNCDHMGINKDDADSIGEQILKQTAQKEYASLENAIDTDWATADNVTDKIPDTGTALYWVCFEVPATGFSTPPIVDEIRVRGTDFDVITGTGFPVFWGKARTEEHERINLVVLKSPGGTGTSTIAMDTNHSQIVFNFNGVDDIAFLWTLPEGIDLSCPITIELGYIADAIDTYNLTIFALKLKDATLTGGGVSSSYTQATVITPVAADTFYKGIDLTATPMSIQDMTSDDTISFELSRTDTSNSIYPMTITIHYVSWTTGEHV